MKNLYFNFFLIFYFIAFIFFGFLFISEETFNYRTDYENWEYWKNFSLKNFQLNPFLINPNQGLFGYSLPVNFWFNPAIILAEILPFENKLFLTKCFLFLFEYLAILYLCSRLGMNKLGTIIVILANSFLFNSVFNQSDWSLFIFENLSGTIMLKVYTILIFSFLIVNDKNFFSSKRLIPILIFFMGLMLNPSYFLIYLFFPIIFLLTAYQFQITKTESLFFERKTEITILFIFILMLLFTYLTFSGISARDIFGAEISSEVQTFNYLNSIFFRNSPYSILFSFIVAVSSFTLLFNKQHSAIGASTLLILLLMLFMGLIYTYSGIIWKYPSPVYFEQSIYPILLCSIGLVMKGKLKIINLLIFLSCFYLFYKISAPRQLELSNILFPNNSSQTTSDSLKNQDRFLISFLKESLDKNSTGSLATIFPVRGEKYFDVLLSSDFDRSNAYSYLLPKKLYEYFDEPLHTTYLWKNGIRTLEDNNHLVSPYKYYFFSRFLSLEDDFQQRNHLIPSLIDDKIFRMLGVRFLLTDETKDLSLIKSFEKQGKEIFLYEYKGFNDANLFYTNIVPFKNIQDFERMMDQNKIDFDKNIYVHEQDLINFEETLTEGSTKRIEIKKGKISLDLRSSGTSILLLPVEFRNAYEVTSGNAKMFRANIFLTALYFKGDVNIEISLHPGLFDTSAGIYRDVKDLKKFNFIPGRVKYPKDYQPESNFGDF